MFAVGESDDLAGLVLISDGKVPTKGGVLRIPMTEDAAQGLVDMLTRLIVTRKKRRGEPVAPERPERPERSFAREPENAPPPPAAGRAPIPHLVRAPLRSAVGLLGTDDPQTAIAAAEDLDARTIRERKQEERRKLLLETKRGNALGLPVAEDDDPDAGAEGDELFETEEAGE